MVLYSTNFDGLSFSALSFWLLSGPADQAEGWAQLTAAQRTSVKSTYNAAGISVIVSAFGATDTPTTAGTHLRFISSK